MPFPHKIETILGGGTSFRVEMGGISWAQRSMEIPGINAGFDDH